MTTKILAACMLAAITLSLLSCDWFEKKHEVINATYLVGKWRLDSIDKSILNVGDAVKGQLFSKPAFVNMLPVTVQFLNDSSYTLYDSTGATLGNDKYYFDSSAQKLFVRENSTFSAYNTSMLSDSSMKVDFENAGLHYIFKKQP